jgi:GWxTD domain-containing protein
MEPDMMIPPLEYLTTTEEFNSLKKGDTAKLTVDNFWLKAGGNVEMARELIRIYYNRMYYSNLFFTSYKQGWRTDRGMIYMIFGPPSYITKTATSEIWEYYVKQDASNLTITFNKVASPYSENHYVMLRNDSYTRYWRTAVDSWRKGKAYSLEE